MTVIGDASPLIVLAKLDRLHLLTDVLSPEITILRGVCDEVLSERAAPIERRRLEEFIQSSSSIADFTESDIESQRLSPSDQQSLTYCIRNRPSELVVDERLLRQIATAHEIPAIGCLGLLMKAVRKGILTRAEAKGNLRKGIETHALKISITLYQRVMKELDLYR